ncbi:MAG: hypothetical protein QXL94_08570 [Candidatus Parvarchaeum sp.]
MKKKSTDLMKIKIKNTSKIEIILLIILIIFILYIFYGLIYPALCKVGITTLCGL